MKEGGNEETTEMHEGSEGREMMEGRKEGRHKGRKEGRHKGRKEGGREGTFAAMLGQRQLQHPHRTYEERKEGGKERREVSKEGRKEGKRKGRKEGSQGGKGREGKGREGKEGSQGRN